MVEGCGYDSVTFRSRPKPCRFLLRGIGEASCEQARAKGTITDNRKPRAGSGVVQCSESTKAPCFDGYAMTGKKTEKLEMPSLLKKICRLARHGDTEQLGRLLRESRGRVDLNAFDRRRYTPLMHAVSGPRADADLVRLLLDHGADPHAESRRTYGEGRTVLSLACRGVTRRRSKPCWTAAPTCITADRKATARCWTRSTAATWTATSTSWICCAC